MSREDAAALLSIRGGMEATIKEEPLDEIKMEADEDEHLVLGPAAFGLHPVGNPPPIRTPSEPAVVLNNRGMPARIRKKNRLFFDDNVVNTLTRASPKRPSIPKSPKKGQASTPRSAFGGRTAITKQEPGTESPPPPPPPPSVKSQSAAKKATPIQQEADTHSPDKRLGHKIGMRLRNLLKLPKAHKWVCYEWFYSNIDKCLFDGDNDFMICLKESFPQLKTRKLSRVEWCKMRRMMGKPRRCSVNFFEEERRELEQKRNKIRLLQQRKLTDVSSCQDLPPEIPLQLVIGTRVTARLRRPKDGLFTGCIDAVDTSNNTYRITFERPGLGTFSVPDYEVLSTEPPETTLVSSFAQKFRPRVAHSSNQQSLTSSSEYTRLCNDPALFSRLLCGDPVLSSSPATSRQKFIPTDGPISGAPVKLLETLVRLQKILKVKTSKVAALRCMNAEVERCKSFGEVITEQFQRKYAANIIELERINADLQEFLTNMQNICQEMGPDPSIATLLTPSHLPLRCRDEAKVMVEKYNANSEKNPVQNQKILDLITDLTGLMVQVKSLSDGNHSPYELKVVQSSMDEIRSSLHVSNQQVFQNCVEVHMQHIQVGLGQRASFMPFMSQRV